MKKFKIQSLLQKNLFKKNILTRNLSKFFSSINLHKSTSKIGLSLFKKKNVENFISEKFQINYMLFFLSIVFFLYLVYLSIPGIVINQSIQKELEEKLKKEYNLDFALTPDINYSILPKPHYSVSDVVIFTEKRVTKKNLVKLKNLKFLLNKTIFLK